jgi:hypothetical protein
MSALRKIPLIRRKMSTMKHKNTLFLLLVGCMFLGFTASEAGANIVIKVRALNPLESQEVAAIRYPLPQEVTPDDIIEQNIVFSLPQEEGAEPRKTTFNIEYVPEEGKYFIIDEIMMGPREVVTLEAHVRDMWFIAEDRLNSIKQEVEDLIARYALAPSEGEEKTESTGSAPEETADIPEEIEGSLPPEQPEGAEILPGKEEKIEGAVLEEGVEEGNVVAEEGNVVSEGGNVVSEENMGETTSAQENPNETAMILQKEIFSELDAIATRQAKSSVLLVGVEKHMEAYYENMEALAQVQTDVIILRNLLEPEELEGEATDAAAEGNIERAPGDSGPAPDNLENLDKTELLTDPADPALESEVWELESTLSE